MGEKGRKTALEAALNYLAPRMRSRLEVEEQLRKKEYDGADIEATIKELIDLRYIDDEVYAESFARYCANRGLGRKRASYELSLKGIDSEHAEIAIENCYDDINEKKIAFKECEKVLALWGKPIYDEDNRFDQRLYGRLVRRLSSKGFEGKTIDYCIRKLKEEYRDNGIL